MRKMNDDEKALMRILIESDKAKENNYECIKMFYEQEYGVIFPNLNGLPNFFTVERYIRKLKQLYPSKLTTAKEREIKANKELEFKEMIRDDNSPLLPNKEEQKKLWGWY